MKNRKHIIFIYAGILFPFLGSAQSYIPLPDSNTEWHLEYYIISPPQNACPGPPYGYCYNYSCQIYKDTIIGSYSYHITNCPMGLVTSSPTYGTVFRQDILSKKVYSIVEGVDSLLYDFNLKLGDTLKQYEPNRTWWGGPWIVTSIDSVYNGANYLKVWIIDNNPDQYFIESIGSPYGLFAGTIFFEQGSILRCMVKNGQMYYPNISTMCTVLTTEERIYNSEVFLSPNPVQQFGAISLNNTILNMKNFSLKIFDITGKQLDQIKGNSIKDISRFNPGIYFIEISVSSQKHIQKLIIY